MRIKLVIQLAVLFVVFETTVLPAQNNPAAKSSKYGIVVLAGNPLPQGSLYRIERSSAGDNDYKDVASICSPRSIKEFRGLTMNYMQFFFPFIKDSSMIIKAWDDLSKSMIEYKPGFYMIHPAMQLASGMAWLDTSALENISYHYRVSMVRGDKEEIKGITDAVKFPSVSALSPVLVRKKSVHEKSVYLEWYVKGKDNPSWFSVFRRQVQKSGFMEVPVQKGFYNIKDTMVLIVMDTLVRNDDNYEYYLQPVDFWGNPSDISEMVRVATTPDNIMPVVTSIITKSIDKEKAIRISWRTNKYPYLRSISILRSENFDGKFEKLTDVPFSDTFYIDRKVEPIKTYYYQIVINTMNKSSFPSARVAGMMKPVDIPFPPVQLHVENVKDVVKLDWKTLDNQLFGCIVYRCNGYKGKMVQVSDMIKPPADLNYFWTDHSNQLSGKEIYSYAVKAISKGNIESIFSDTVSITPSKPVEPPMTPAHLKTRILEKSIIVAWDDMYHLDPYVMGYNIYRKEAGNEKSDKSTWVKLNKELISQKDNLYIDTNLIAGTTYQYTVESVDIFSNKSAQCNPVTVTTMIVKPPAPGGLVVYRTDEGLLLKWDGVIMDDLAGYKVYRSVEGSNPDLIFTSKPDDHQFIDKNTKSDVLYFYYITAFTKNGAESDPGMQVSVRK